MSDSTTEKTSKTKKPQMVPISEARKKIAHLVDHVYQGKGQVIITWRGTPMAVLIAPPKKLQHA